MVCTNSISDTRISLNQHELGQRSYECKDHLGNVHLVLSDRKPFQDYDNTLAAYEYYPFGMLMQSYTSAFYRFGFNSMEKDDEVSGGGNHYDLGARFYDSRLGRFKSGDPKEDVYPSNSTYNFAMNSPIVAIDADGEGVHITVLSPYVGEQIALAVDSDEGMSYAVYKGMMKNMKPKFTEAEAEDVRKQGIGLDGELHTKSQYDDGKDDKLVHVKFYDKKKGKWRELSFDLDVKLKKEVKPEITKEGGRVDPGLNSGDSGFPKSKSARWGDSWYGDQIEALKIIGDWIGGLFSKNKKEEIVTPEVKKPEAKGVEVKKEGLPDGVVKIDTIQGPTYIDENQEEVNTKIIRTDGENADTLHYTE